MVKGEGVVKCLGEDFFYLNIYFAEKGMELIVGLYKEVKAILNLLKGLPHEAYVKAFKKVVCGSFNHLQSADQIVNVHAHLC
jgi:hypothetical protein